MWQGELQLLLCLYFGQVASQGLLDPRQTLMLPIQWKDSHEQSIMQGNNLHGKRFHQEAVNLDAKEAAGQQLDLFGTYGEELLAGWLNELSSRKNRSWHLFCASEKTILFFVDSNGEVYFVDSHLKTSKKSDWEYMFFLAGFPLLIWSHVPFSNTSVRVSVESVTIKQKSSCHFA